MRTGRVGRVGTAGVDRIEALELVAQTAYVRGGSAGQEHGDVGSAREGHDGTVAGYNNVDGTAEAAAVWCDDHGDIDDDGLL